MEIAADGVDMSKSDRGSTFDREELGKTGPDNLDQVANLTYLLVKGTSPESRKKLLEGSTYIIGVARKNNGLEEDPEYIVWIRKGDYEVSTTDPNNPQQVHTRISISRNGPPVVQKEIATPEDLRGALDANHNARVNAALGAQDWLKETRQFLLEKTTVV